MASFVTVDQYQAGLAAIAARFNAGGGGSGGTAGVLSVNGQAGVLTLTGGNNVTITRTNKNFTFDVAAAVSSVAGRTGAVVLAPGDVSLGNVDNTSDLNKPLSTAASNALAGKQVSIGFQGQGSTLGSTGNVSVVNFTGNVSASRSGDTVTLSFPSPNYPVTSVAGRTGAVSLVKGDVGLPNVDNTSDANKPISTATQSALDGKHVSFAVQNAGSTLGTAGTVDTINFSSGATVSRSGNVVSIAITGGGGGGSGEVNTASNLGTGTGIFAQKNGVDLQFKSLKVTGAASISATATEVTVNVPTQAAPVTSVAGRTGDVTLTKTDVGLGNVDNTSDANKPVSTAQMTAIGAKADKDKRVAMGANDVDLSQGTFFTKTISGATTLTFSNAAASPLVSSFILELTNGGSAAITYPSGTKWSGGTAPTLTASGIDRLGFIYDGTNWNGLVLGKAFA